MSDPKEPDELEEPPAEDGESPALKALLQRSLASDAAREPLAQPARAKDQALLRAVQKKLRQRSRGKFYADGWSTAQSRVNYVLVAAIMLATIVAVYVALGPTGVAR